MIWFLFCAFVAVIALGFLASGVVAHITHIRNAAGWWVGVLLSITMFILAQPFFQSMPQELVRVTEQSGCDRPYTREVNQTAWDTFASEVVQVNLFSVLIGFIVCLAGLEILQRWIDMPEKVLAFIFLTLACASLSTLLYVFLIRKLSHLVFSAVLGIIIGIPVHIAFFAELEKWKKRVDSL